MKSKKTPKLLIVFTALYLIVFTTIFLLNNNYEFIFYLSLVVAVFIFVVQTYPKFQYSKTVLWGLSIAGLLHMAGGSVNIQGDNLYSYIIWPIGEVYPVLRYDQVVHAYGYFVITAFVYQILCYYLKLKSDVVIIFAVLAALGIGNLNEIVEFLASEVTQAQDREKWLNVSLDLVSDFIGSALAGMLLYWKRDD